MKAGWVGFGLATALLGSGGEAAAQRAGESAVGAAGDAFGTNIGTEQVGLYSGTDTRGFSPTTAGNVRLDGMYIDAPLGISPRLVSGSQIRVGLTAQSYPFPAPTGIIDYALRPVGERPVQSLVLAVGPHAGYTIEYDAQLPIIPGHFGIAYGIFANRAEMQNDDTVSTAGLAIMPRWRPRAGLEIRPYYALHVKYNDKANPLVFVSGPVLPKKPTSRNISPKWTDNDTIFHDFGLQASAVLNRHWTLRGNFFGFTQDDEGPISDSFLNTGADGVALTRRFTNQRPFDYLSTSGEARLTGVFAGKDLRHTVHLAARARAIDRSYGGGAAASFANVPIGRDNAPAEPTWVYGPSVDDAVRQQSVGVSYALARRGLGEIGFGLQKVHYEKTLRPQAGGRSVTAESPLFWNAAVSLNISEKLAAYGAMTRGLEEAPLAPDVAANAQEAPPAIHTRQAEFGFRYIIRPRLRLVVGYFDIEKPYFALDAVRVWRELGIERHRGVETSLTGELAPGLNVVFGYVLQQPRVSGEAVRAGLIGADPVGQSRETARANVSYRLPRYESLSLESALIYNGGRPVSSRKFSELGNRQLRSKAIVGLEVGLRYRFDLDEHPATLRLQAQNFLNRNGWNPGTSGGMGMQPGRRFTATLTTDF